MPTTRLVEGQRPQQLRGQNQEHRDLIQHLQMWARENPSSAALWCLGIGFVLGWKTKPW